MTGLLIILTWIGLAIKDFVSSKRNTNLATSTQSRQFEPSANNFALRFFYELFFEFSLCALINIGLVDFSSFTAVVQWLTSIIVSLLILAYLVWLISLFFYNGPFLANFYNRGTFLQSIWMARPFNTKFDAYKKLGWL